MRERAVIDSEDVAAPAAHTADEDAVKGEPEAKPEAKSEKEERKDKARIERERPSAAMRSIANTEDQSLKDWLETIGTVGAFKIALSRISPRNVVKDGKTFQTEGHLETYEEPIDEAFIQQEWGGGKYSLKVTRQHSDGSYRWEKGLHRTITVAGAPLLDRLPGGAPGPTAPQASTSSGDSPAIVKAVLDTMKDQLDHARKAPGIDPAVTMLLEQMRADAASRDQQIRDLQARLERMQGQKPPEDPIKDQLLGTLIKGESGRVDSLRTAHEAEIRTLREGHQQEVRLLNERFDRERDATTRQHERTLDTLKAGYEREIAAMKHLAEVNTTAVSGTFNVQVRTLEGDIKRLERDNGDLRTEVKELREKKEKSLFDQLKEIKALKEALDTGDEKEAAGAWEKIAEHIANPALIEQIGKVFQRPAPAQAQAAAVQAAAPQQQARQAAAGPPRIMRDPRTGLKFAQTPQGLVPVKKIPKMVDAGNGQAVEVPEVEPAQLALLISYMERAFASRQDPVVVAQSARTNVPPKIVAWIRDNDTPGQPGVDLFMNKVAKLPEASPLRTQRGKNWIRQVAKALIGDDPEQESEPTEAPPEPAPTEPPAT